MQMVESAEQDVLFEYWLFIIRRLKDWQENISAALSQMECQTLQFLLKKCSHIPRDINGCSLKRKWHLEIRCRNSKINVIAIKKWVINEIRS